MSINSTLKKEGIKVIGKLNTLEINKIAANISEKIVTAFPEHNLNQHDLFASIARLNMYLAEMPNDMAMAKYFYKNNSIYFSKDMDLTSLHTLALHECLHFIQELKDKNGKLLRFGLYNLENRASTGMALNEAAVQLISSKINGIPVILHNSSDNITPAAIPIPPPETVMITASVRNSDTIFHAVAPTERFIPISRVRSLTETSITVIMDIPETMMLIPATTDKAAEAMPIILFILSFCLRRFSTFGEVSVCSR